MKKYDGVLKRVRELEYKRGIKYADTNSRIYKTFKVFYILMLIWATATNVIFILGHLLLYSNNDNINVSEFKNRIIIVSVGGLLLITGAVLNRFKVYIVSASVSLIAAAFLSFSFARMLPDDFGFLQLKTAFYVRHFIPLTLLVIFLLCLTVIAVRARIKTDRMYKKVTENLYNMYHISGDDASNITDEQWDEFLKNYNPDKKFNTAEETGEDEG